MLSAPQRHYNSLCLTAALLLALPAFGISSTVTGIEANGTCDSGTCSTGGLSSGALTPGNSTNGSYNFTVDLSDGDDYLVTGTYSNSFPSGPLVGFFPTVTLESGAGAGGTAAGTDTITLDMLQDFFASGAIDWDSTFTETIPFNFSASDESAAGQRLISTSTDPTPQSVGDLSASGPGETVLHGSKYLSGLDGDTLVTDYQLAFTFDEGALPGSSISSPVPEPSQTIPIAVGFVGLILLNLRRVCSSGTRA